MLKDFIVCIFRQIMTRVVKSLVIHAGHLVQVCVSALLPLCNGNAPDHIREISISVLADVAKVSLIVIFASYYRQLSQGY